REIARLALRVGRVDFAFEIELFQRQRDFLRETDADETASGDRIAVANETHRFGGRDDLALLRVAQIGQSRMLAHGAPPRIAFLYSFSPLWRGEGWDEGLPRQTRRMR